MKLEAGMYVRTKWGIARLIGECWGDFGGDLAYAVDCCLQPIDETKIFKEDIIGEPSFNPIDLIKVGDYVNGEKVIALEKDIDKRNIYPSNIGAKIFTDYEMQGNWYFGIQEKDIKSIVTKEQFESMEYRIGE